MRFNEVNLSILLRSWRLIFVFQHKHEFDEYRFFVCFFFRVLSCSNVYNWRNHYDKYISECVYLFFLNFLFAFSFCSNRRSLHRVHNNNKSTAYLLNDFEYSLLVNSFNS